MAITALPTPPSRAQSPANFSSTADTFVAALPTFTAEANALAVEVEGLRDAAATSATNAAASATAASGSVTTAAASATSAAGSATAASGYADDASTSATQSAGAASGAASTFVAMDKRYLGAKSAAPSLDNQGASLQSGATYFDTALSKIRAWNGASWVDGISSIAGVASLNGETGHVTGIQPTLVSGSNIKTINGLSVVGSGDVEVGRYVFLGEVVSTTSSMVEFTSVLDPLMYDEYEMRFNFLLNSASYFDIYVQLMVNASWVESSAYAWSAVGFSSSAPSYGSNAASADAHLNTSAGRAFGGFNVGGKCNIFDSVNTKTINSSIYHSQGSSNATTSLGSCFVSSAGTLDGIRIFPSTSGMAGTFRLYGIRKN